MDAITISFSNCYSILFVSEREAYMEYYLQRATELSDEIIANRRYIHENAETGMELPNTVRFVREQLKSYGIESEECGGGVVAYIGKPGGKTILLRADMDALVQNEVSGVPFACKSGNACHSCGHDCHTSMLLAAAKMLKEKEAELDGQVMLMFQPAEEYIIGAKSMIDAGLFDKVMPDAAFGMHIQFGPNDFVDALTGKPVVRHPKLVTYALGFEMKSADEPHILVHGKSAHGSEPNMGCSAISAACAMVTALERIISMEISARDEAAYTICKFNGGTAVNIIADEVEFSGTFRTMDNSVRDLLFKRTEEVCKGIAAAFGVTVDIKYRVGVPCVYNEPEFTKEMVSYGDEIVPVSKQVNIINGSEDFALIAEAIPKSTFLFLCAGSPEEGYNYPAHDPHMTLDEDTFRYGAALYAHCAQRWLANNK